MLSIRDSTLHQSLPDELSTVSLQQEHRRSPTGCPATLLVSKDCFGKAAETLAAEAILTGGGECALDIFDVDMGPHDDV